MGELRKIRRNNDKTKKFNGLRHCRRHRLEDWRIGGFVDWWIVGCWWIGGLVDWWIGGLEDLH